MLNRDLQELGVHVLKADQGNIYSIIDVLNYLSTGIDTYSVCILEKGTISLEYDLQTHYFEENSIFIISSFIPFLSYPQYSDDFELTMLTFVSSMPIPLDFSKEFTQLITYYFARKFYPIKNLEQQELARVKDVIQLIHVYVMLKEDYAYRLDIVQSLFKVFFHELVRIVSKHAQLIDEKPTVKKTLFIDFFMSVKRNFKKNRELSFYSEALFVTSKYLSEVVKLYYGSSAKKLIEDMVIHEAKYLLSDQTISIYEISNELNFNDQSMFGKYFKNATGLSPKKYRDDLQQRIINPI